MYLCIVIISLYSLTQRNPKPFCYKLMCGKRNYKVDFPTDIFRYNHCIRTLYIMYMLLQVQEGYCICLNRGSGLYFILIIFDPAQHLLVSTPISLAVACLLHSALHGLLFEGDIVGLWHCYCSSLNWLDI